MGKYLQFKLLQHSKHNSTALNNYDFFCNMVVHESPSLFIKDPQKFLSHVLVV